ncbi:hypothetical protein ACFL0O_10400 [Thermodesulfobacteriota bacterium]
MDLDKMMEDYGFSLSSSCSGFEWYTKTLTHRGKDAYITITDDGGAGLPGSLDAPVLVEIYDFDSGNAIERSRRFESLKVYLDTLEP